MHHQADARFSSQLRSWVTPNTALNCLWTTLIAATAVQLYYAYVKSATYTCHQMQWSWITDTQGASMLKFVLPTRTKPLYIREQEVLAFAQATGLTQSYQAEYELGAVTPNDVQTLIDMYGTSHSFHTQYWPAYEMISRALFVYAYDSDERVSKLLLRTKDDSFSTIHIPVTQEIIDLLCNAACHRLRTLRR